MNKTDWIQHLQLTPHIEGGYFRRTYQSDYAHIGSSYTAEPRYLMTSIFYMLTDESPIGYLHVNQADIMHYFHAGSALTYYLVSPTGQLEVAKLGNNPAAGEQLQLLVKGGVWKATVLKAGEFALLSEAVSPGFDYVDMQLISQQQVQACGAEVWQVLQKYVKP